ncbi:MAG: EAL domain-containing protein [Candidatus Eremiobacterota bacterium]
MARQEFGQMPSGASHEVTALRAQLRQAEEKLQAAQGRIAELEAHVLRLEQGPPPDVLERLRLIEERLQVEQERSAQALQQARARINELESRVPQQAEGPVLEQLKEQLRLEQERSAQARRQVDEYQARVARLEQSARTTAGWGADRVEQLEMRLRTAQQKQKQAEELAEAAQEQVRQLAYHDALTGLPNLRQFEEFLEMTATQVFRYRRPAALLLLDLDRFKVINHAIGMEAGDGLLKEVAERLQTAARESDRVARRGEDEFLVLLTELSEHLEPAEAAEAAATRLLAQLAHPFSVQGQDLTLHATIGISLMPGDASRPQEAMQHADNALYRAKELGGNRIQIYEEELGRSQARRLTTGRELERALETNELFLEYRPIVKFGHSKTMGIVDSGKLHASLVGLEALVRWRHRVQGVIGPEDFIPTAEETGLITQLSRWMIREACQAFQGWRDPTCTLLSLDLSPRQLLLQRDLVQVMAQEAQRAGLQPKTLMVDIAEEFHTEAAGAVEGVLREMSEAGIGVAIDDFGQRLGSLGRLDSRYTRIVKIAPELVATCTENNACLAVINLARSLGLVPFAKGVTTREQARFLARNNCEMAHGDFFSAPLKPEEVQQLLKQKPLWKL